MKFLTKLGNNYLILGTDKAANYCYIRVMQAFLEQVAIYLKDRLETDWSKHTLVFSNRRSALFFNKYLKGLYDKPLFAPKVYTISEWFEHLIGGQKADKLHLLFELYEAYCFVMKSSESFDQFYYWGNMMLRDFDELDKYLLNPKHVFANVQAHKEIESELDYLSEEQLEYLTNFWKVFEESKVSNEKEQFYSIWSKLHEIYDEFNARLDQRQWYYEGKLFRNLVEKIEDSNALDQHSSISFIGFNALNACEKTLFSHIKKAKKCRFFWDYDPYYLNNRFHEAGYFMRQNVVLFPSPKDFVIETDIKKRIDNQSLNIQVYSVGMQMGQSIKMGELLSQINVDVSDEQTAIVLPDEQLLMPVLQSIPSNIDRINISMGYSFRETPLYALLENILDLQQQSKLVKEKVQFYHHNVFGLLNHPYLQFETKQLRKEIDHLLKQNLIWMNSDQIPFFPMKHLIFKACTNKLEVNQMILDLLKSLHVYFREVEENQLETEFIYHSYNHIQKFNEQLKSLSIELEFDTYVKLLRQVLLDINVPFIGEPLDGLQVMGVLETRSLDFKNVFILSMNEGSMPASGSDNSFIPYNLRKGYGLPVTEEFDAVYAYYFYRLIQRADNVFLFYNNIQEGDVKSEKSRFLYQLEYELNKKNLIQEFIQKSSFKQTAQHSIEINNDRKYVEQFLLKDGKVEKYLTPSAINKFLDCSLSFYYRYILKLYPKDDIQEEVDHASFGNLLHEAMELLYKDYIAANDRNITSTSIELIDANLESTLDKVIMEQMGVEADAIEGDLFVVRNIIIQYIRRILDLDKAYAPFKIIGLETDREDAYQLISKSGFGIEGKIDRIDLKDNVLRIVDYKTGSVNYEVRDFEALLDSQGSINKYALQAFLYASLYLEKHSDTSFEILPFIIGVKDLYDDKVKGSFEYKGKESFIDKGEISDFKLLNEKWLELVDDRLKDLLDDSFVYTQTEKLTTCTFCDYQSICNR